MKKLFKFKHRRSINQGFTTLEILISIIIALAFISVAMQSFVLAMGMKVQAQEKQRANQLIQEDLEKVTTLGSNITQDHDNKCNPIATPTSSPPKTAYQNGYAYELWEAIDEEPQPTAHLLKTTDGTESGKKIGSVRQQINDLTDPSPSEDAPYRTLKISFQVRELDSDDEPTGDVIAERYVEVIPDVALQCP